MDTFRHITIYLSPSSCHRHNPLRRHPPAPTPSSSQSSATRTAQQHQPHQHNIFIYSPACLHKVLPYPNRVLNQLEQQERHQNNNNTKHSSFATATEDVEWLELEQRLRLRLSLRTVLRGGVYDFLMVKVFFASSSCLLVSLSYTFFG